MPKLYKVGSQLIMFASCVLKLSFQTTVKTLNNMSRHNLGAESLSVLEC